jgi:hypothetical protein
MRFASLFGQGARMGWADSANVVIDMDEANGRLEADFVLLDCPAVFVLGTGGHPGATEAEMATVRAAVTKAETAGTHVSRFATSPANHVRILAQSPDIVAGAVADVVNKAVGTTI